MYNFGSCTSFCTFGWLTHLLLGVLRFAHGITWDWAVSIVILVLIVRPYGLFGKQIIERV